MRCVASILVLSQAAVTNPISKVIDLIGSLKSKVVQEGVTEQESYEKFAKWCKAEATQKQYEIRDGQNSVEQLSATIEKADATIQELDARIAKLTTTISTNENDLGAAKDMRKKEHEDYSSNDKESVEVIDTLEKAIATLEKALKKGSTLVQVVNNANMKSLVSSLSAVLDAGVISMDDKAKLNSMLQAHDDAEFNAGSQMAQDPNQGASILDVLGDLLDKAESQKQASDKAEMTSRFNFEKLKQSLTDQIAFDNKQVDTARKGLASNQEVKATAEGDLQVTQKELAVDTQTLNDAHDECESKAEEWTRSMQERKAECDALDKAVEILKEATGGAEKQAYGLLQQKTNRDWKGVLTQITEAGKKGKDKQLIALAVRVKAALGSSTDPFAKVKELIVDMLDRLERQVADEAAQHEFCVTETAKSTDKKEDKQSSIESLSAKINKANSLIAKRKEQITDLQGELANIARTNQEMTEMRSQEHAAFLQQEKDYSDGVDGIQMALKVIRDYYATSENNKGAGGSVLSVLEVAESDFSRLLTEARETEQESQEKYDQLMEENTLATTTKKGGVKYKTQEVGQLQKAVAENSDELDGTQTELDAVLEYLSKLNDQCVAKAEPYEERKRRREEELAGLKNALDILEGEAIGFLAVKTVHRHQ